MTENNKLRAKLARAEAAADAKRRALFHAAVAYAREHHGCETDGYAPGRISGALMDAEAALIATAKAHTNAENQASRCRKHVRDAGGDLAGKAAS